MYSIQNTIRYIDFCFILNNSNQYICMLRYHPGENNANMNNYMCRHLSYSDKIFIFTSKGMIMTIKKNLVKVTKLFSWIDIVIVRML